MEISTARQIFHGFVEYLAKEPHKKFELIPESRLPYSKQEIKDAIKALLRETYLEGDSGGYSQDLINAYSLVGLYFQPERTVNAEKDAKAFIKRQEDSVVDDLFVFQKEIKREIMEGNIEKKIYDIQATKYSKENIWWWMLSGLAYNFIAGKLISVSSLLLFLPGIFIISLLSLPVFLLDRRINQKIIQTKKIVILIGCTAWKIFSFAYPIILSLLYLYLINLAL